MLFTFVFIIAITYLRILDINTKICIALIVMYYMPVFYYEFLHEVKHKGILKISEQTDKRILKSLLYVFFVLTVVFRILLCFFFNPMAKT